MDEMMDMLVKGQNFHEYDPCFKSDVQSKVPFSANYIFIEPNYGNAFDSNTEADFEGGNSQHSVGDVTKGERLIKDTYETIRNSKLWPESCLVITYDEHGGFFDHIKPPITVPPGDKEKYNINKFDFKRLGVRVPAVVISPWVEKGFVDQNTVYDHSSIPATLKKRFKLTDFLTNRDRNANTFDRLFTRTTPRVTPTDAPTKLPDPFVSAKAMSIESIKTNDAASKPLDENTKSFLHMVTRADMTLNPNQRDKILTRVKAIKTQRDAHIYIAEVQKQMRTKKGQKCD
jgi:phospholipase C